MIAILIGGLIIYLIVFYSVMRFLKWVSKFIPEDMNKEGFKDPYTGEVGDLIDRDSWVYFSGSIAFLVACISVVLYI